MSDVHAPQPQHTHRGFHPFPAQLPPDPPAVTELADGLVDLARLALAFGRIDRTAVYHPDQVTPESDTDHTVMLGWAACAIAKTWFPGQLDVGLVAQYSLVHDAPEVYAGDTPTLRITDGGRAAKATREAAAVDRLAAEFTHRLPWFVYTLRNYEEQRLPEARFVRGVDKIMPKLVHLLDRCTGLIEQGISRAELADVFAKQREDMTGYVGEFQALMDIRDELVRRVLERPELADEWPDSDPSFREHGNHPGCAWCPDLAEAAPNGGRNTTRGEGR
jgi:5'-deoxynucleotidase YfbR-like HD superfamily hydrolase